MEQVKYNHLMLTPSGGIMKKSDKNIYIAKLGSKCLLLMLLVLVIIASPLAASRNVLPRTPELIIEKGFSDTFRITSCVEKVNLTDKMAESTLKVVIKNTSEKEVTSSVKFRILYPRSSNTVRIRINGKSIRYDRENPRHAFKLSAGGELKIDMSAKTGINFSVDALKDALRKNAEAQNGSKNKPKSQQILQNFAKVFARENFGKRFMVSSLVSKWGIFPIDFDKVEIEVSVPRDFVLVSNNEKSWEQKKTSSSVVYSFTGTKGFNGSVFLPATDVENFKTWQKISSEM